ncbi:unnamed protein product [Sphenostylis stenocarpa]|uniref:Uncharacterized protein n=1 Tax=Sphenostylis stenocarpa TaxID=92480 RepID=A0AA86SX78_9FABA|nr:unnamed protein product [Sphenostylis stenocarpa]
MHGNLKADFLHKFSDPNGREVSIFILASLTQDKLIEKPPPKGVHRAGPISDLGGPSGPYNPAEYDLQNKFPRAYRNPSFV